MNQALAARAQLERMRRMDAVCRRFERALKDGARPRIEDELAASDAADHADLLAELLPLEWLYCRQRGEAVGLDESRDRFPGAVALVESLWKRWQQDRDPGAASSSHVPETEVPAGPSTHNRRDIHPPGFTVPPGYEQLEALGEGGMGTVFKALEVRANRCVAMKWLRLDQTTPDRLRRFEVEATALAQLTNPHIVPLFAFLENSGQPVLVMEYAARGTLEKHLTCPLPPAEAARLVAILAWAVHAAHEKGIVHRDLKPANVLLADPVPGSANNVLGGFPKISDFGLAQVIDAETRHTAAGMVLGTPHYMSSEQAAGRTEQIGPPTDVWALGVILYRCLSGVLPFKGDTVLETLEQIKTMRAPRLRDKRPDLPLELEDVCLACLHKEPGRRPSAADLALRLERLGLDLAQRGPLSPLPRSPGETPTEPPTEPHMLRRGWSWHGAAQPSAGNPTPTFRPRRRLLIGGLRVLLAALAIGWGLWSWSKDGSSPLPSAAPVRIVTFRVHQLRLAEGKLEDHGEIGKEAFEPRVDDLVTLEVELSREGYLYLVALNVDGKEQLLWPADARDSREADPGTAPLKLQRLSYPPANPQTGMPRALPLNDDPKGGLQAFAVLVSASPLPAYADYNKARGRIGWSKLPGGKGVWLGDRMGVYAARRGLGVVRGKAVDLPGVPPLMGLARKLEAGGVELAEVLAFPVRMKEDN